MIIIAILFVFSMISLFLYRNKQDVSFNAKDAANMVSPKTLKAQDIDNIASWCHSCGEHGLKIDVKIQPDNG